MADKQAIMSTFDQALIDENVPANRVPYFRSIFQQESGSGGNTKTSSAGAVGAMQIIPSTFNSVADTGWDINDISHNARAGIRYANKMLELGGGNFALGAAGYYGGPGGLAKARAGVAVGDPRNPNAPTTLQYGQQVVDRMGGAGGVSVDAGGAVPEPTSKQRVRALSATEALIQQQRGLPGAAATAPLDEAALFTKAGEELAAKEEARPTGLEMFGAALSGATTSRAARAVMHRYEQAKDVLTDAPENIVDPAWKPPFADLVGRPRDQIQELAETPNKARYEALLAKWGEEDFRNKTINDRGLGLGLGLSLGAELIDPVNLATGGYAAMRAAAGIAQAAKAGNTLGVVGRSIAENLVQGTAVEGAIQLGEGKFDPGNLALSLLADSVLGAAAGNFVSFRANGMRELQVAAASKLEREGAMLEKARGNLGPAHTQAQLDTEYLRLRTEEMKAPFVEAFSPARADRKLMTSPDEAIAKSESLLTNVVPELRQGDGANFNTTATIAREDFGKFANAEGFAERAAKFVPGGQYEPQIALRSGGTATTLAELEKLPAGIHAAASVPNTARLALDGANSILRKMLGEDFRVTLDVAKLATPDGKAYRGEVLQVSEKAAMVRVSSTLGPQDMLRTTMHEMSHIVFNKYVSKLSSEELGKLDNAFQRFIEANKSPDGWGDKARAMRFSLLSPDLDPSNTKPKFVESTAYGLSRDEFSAEQIVKFFEEDAATANKTGFTANVKATVKAAVMQVLEFLRLAKRENIGVSDEYRSFVESIMEGKYADKPSSFEPKGIQRDVASDGVEATAFLTNPDAIRFGMATVPVATAADRATAKAMLDLHLKAEEWSKANPFDAAWKKRAGNLADNSLFNVASTGLLMLKSPSPLLRMIASELLEDASGVAAKRNSTAAISKKLRQEFYMGNSIPDVQNSYAMWRKDAGGSLIDDTFGGGEVRARFDKEVAQEIEARRLNGGQRANPNEFVDAAVRSLHGAYERMRLDQISNKTLGWAGLPTKEQWYMPHSMSPNKVNVLSNSERQVLHNVLVEQYTSIEGWDAVFSDKLAAKVVEAVRGRALGSYDTKIGGNSAASAEVIEEALGTMGLSAEEIRSRMANFNKGAANFTKARIDLDLNKVYSVDGKDFKLIDLFETDQLTLLRSQAGRVSGEVALARHGVYGKPGLDIIRKAMQYGEDGARLVTHEDKRGLESFDQIAAEFLNAPFGKSAGKGIERAMMLNSAVRLGGIVYNQFAEFINGMTHVGVNGVMSSIAGIPRLRKEIDALVRGEKVNNGLLDSIETLGGAEFGTDAYKMILPYDSPDHAYPTYGTDTLTSADRLLRGAGHLQAKLSLWRYVHSAQQRGMAEQVVAKMARYVKEGREDVALAQFGIGKDLADRMRLDIDKVAQFGPSGKTIGFDVTKFTDKDVAEQVVQSVHRGVSQIIQSTFIGEQGKWAHDGYMKLMTQFRSFSIVSMEKQWARQRNSRGTAGALGILVGSMGAAIPVYMARVYASSIGKDDQEAYIEKRLHPAMLARAVLNYVGLSGTAPDLLDAGAALAPDAWGMGAMTGGRAGTDTDFIGNLIVPSASIVNDSWKALQNLDDPAKLAKVLPLSRVPLLLPAINALTD